MLREKIQEVIDQSEKTGMTIMGGYLPHSPYKDLTPRDISAGLQRLHGWVVSPATVAKFM